MSDETEYLRRDFVAQNTAAVQSDDIEKERVRLETIHGKDNVWDTQQLQQNFSVQSFAAPFCRVERKSDNVAGYVEFQHSPRLYFNFSPVK
jgi:hypothetical protein